MKHQQQTRVEGRESRTEPAKCYEPVREFERATSYCPLYLAWRIVDEARDYFRTPIPEAFADQLARRAEAVFAKHALSSAKWRNGRGGAFLKTPLSGSLPVWRGEREKSFWWRKFQNREFILMFMRHWLADVLARENPALFRDLPESFKVGEALPSSVLRTPSPIRRAKGISRSDGRGITERENHRPRFVHGCELLAV
jgi:hypothetical protein